MFTTKNSFSAAIFLLFLLFFGLLFLQFPLQGSLPGKIDTWFYVVAFNTIDNMLAHFFTGEWIGTALFPETNVYSFGNYSWLGALGFLPFKWMGINDLWAYYIFMVLVFATNAWATFRFASLYTKERALQVLAGFAFAASNFAFGNMDNPDALIFAPAILSVYYFKLFLETGQQKHIAWTVILGGLQPYFSSYNFLFQSILLGAIGLMHLRTILTTPKLRNGLFIWLPVHILLLVPFLQIYIFDGNISHGWNPAEDLDHVTRLSLNLPDFFRYLKNNLLYPPLTDLGNWNNFIYKTRSAGFGFCLLLLAIYGWIKSKPQRLELGLFFVIFLCLAFGPYLAGANYKIYAPAFPLYKYLHINQLFRTCVRAYFICYLVIVLFAVLGLQALIKQYRFRKWYLLIPFVLISLENIPIPFTKYNSIQYMEPPTAYYPTLAQNRHLQILNLPSSFFSWLHPDFKKHCQGAEDVHFEVIREHLYMYWQVYHKQHIINGFAGFIPESRIDNQLLINDLQLNDHLTDLINKNNLDYIFYHKWLENSCTPGSDLDYLKASPLLKIKSEDDQLVVFEVTPTE